MDVSYVTLSTDQSKTLSKIMIIYNVAIINPKHVCTRRTRLQVHTKDQ